MPNVPLIRNTNRSINFYSELYGLAKHYRIFDESYYLEQNNDVKTQGVDPLEHYLLHGINEGRRPHKEHFFLNIDELRNYFKEKKNPNVPIVRRPNPIHHQNFLVPRFNHHPNAYDEINYHSNQRTYAKINSISAVIPTLWKVPHFTLPLLKYLIKNNIETVLVWTSKNKIPDEMPEGVKCIQYDKNKFNYSYALNLGYKETNGDFIFFLNDDLSICDDRWMSRIIDELNNDLTIAAASPIILNPDGSVQRSGAYLNNVTTSSAVVTYNEMFDDVREFITIGGPALGIRREAWAPFDEEFELYCSDDVFTLGKKSVVVGHSRILHKQNSTVGSNPLISQKDILLFFKKYGTCMLSALPSLDEKFIKPNIIDKEKVKHIVLMKPDHYGDIAFSLDAIQMIKNTFNHAYLTMICNTFAIPMMKKIGFDQILPLDIYEEGGSGAKTRNPESHQIDSINNLFPDIAINLRGDDIGVDWMLMTQPKLSVSFSNKTNLYRNLETDKSMRWNFLNLLTLIPVVSSKNYLVGKGNAIGIHPFASVPDKQYPLNQIKQIIDWLKERQIPVVLFCNNGQEEPIKSWGCPIENNIPMTEYAERVADKCYAYIGMDSGPTHFVAQAGLPTVQIIGNQAPVTHIISQGLYVTGVHRTEGVEVVLSALGRSIRLTNI